MILVEKPPGEAPFEVQSSRRGSVVTARVAGELDIATVPQLESSLPPLAPGDELVLDLRPLTFIDSSGVRLLMTLDIGARAEGWSMRITCEPGRVHDLLTLCRAHERIPIATAPSDGD